MAFSLPDHWVWDFWFADDGDLYHLYYLHAPKSLGHESLRHRNARVGHATSADLVSWENLGEVLVPGAPGDFDESATWTGSVIQGPDGLWWMFYTGTRFLSESAHANVETIGAATSTDLHTWTKLPGPLLRADPTWYETLGNSEWPEESWRDPWVFADEDGNGWHMLITARANHGAVDDRGVIGHATSKDLLHWAAQPPLSAPGSGFGHLEVPQMCTIDGETILLFSCDTAKLSEESRQAGNRGGIWCLAPQSSGGPYDAEHAALLETEELYSGRAVQDRSGEWVVLAFLNTSSDGTFGGAVSDPLRYDWKTRERVQLESEGAPA